MEDLNQILLTKPAEVVQEAHQVLEKHGWHVKMLKSELYYSSPLCLPSYVPSTALRHVRTNCIDCFNLHTLFKDTFQTV